MHKKHENVSSGAQPNDYSSPSMVIEHCGPLPNFSRNFHPSNFSFTSDSTDDLVCKPNQTAGDFDCRFVNNSTPPNYPTSSFFPPMFSFSPLRVGSRKTSLVLCSRNFCKPLNSDSTQSLKCVLLSLRLFNVDLSTFKIFTHWTP